jgi:hypothetical protein
MKLRLLILLAAAALAAAPAAGQTIKSLGYNTTNGQIVYSGTNALTFTNALQFSTNARAATRTNLGGTTVGDSVFTATNAAAARSAIGLGTTNSVVFGEVATAGFAAFSNVTEFYGPIWFGDRNGTNDIFQFEAADQGVARTNLGLGATNAVTFSNITATGTLAVSNAATFATNVSIAGSLSVGSFTTTTPSTWALDATQTAAATNGMLTLPSNGNVIRLTNNNAISSVTNGVLGAFYYLVNQATNAVTISNVGGITIDGAQNLTLSPNESATLVATGPTNVSVAGRGDLTDVALGGTANTAPSQTASSGSSLMTRGLSDGRYFGFSGLQIVPVEFSRASQNLTNGGSISVARGAIRITSGITNGSGGGLTFLDSRILNQTLGTHTGYQGYGIYAISPQLGATNDTVFGIFYGSVPANGVPSFEPLSTNGYSVQWRNNGTQQLRYLYKNGTNEVSGPWTSLPAASSSSVQFAGVNTTNGFRVIYKRPEGLGVTDWTVLTNVAVSWTWGGSGNSAGAGWSAVAFIRTNTTSTNSLSNDLGEFGFILGGENL